MNILNFILSELICNWSENLFSSWKYFSDSGIFLTYLNRFLEITKNPSLENDPSQGGKVFRLLDFYA